MNASHPEAELRRLAGEADSETVWPAASWDAARRLGALRWSIPKALGGDGLSGIELLERYESLAQACLTTAFILSQREAACRRILTTGQTSLRERIAHRLAQGEAYATVGLSHLTTSRQHLAPQVVAVPANDGFALTGTVPWVTGAGQAEYIVTGGITEEGRQVLGVIRRSQGGVTVDPPLELAALAGSITAPIRLESVRLEGQWLFDPSDSTTGSGGLRSPGGIETSCLALGLTGAALNYLQAEASARPDLVAASTRLQAARDSLWRELRSLASNGADAGAAALLRARANALVLRVTQAALTASKGAGFVRSHPAQRWARQALFFLVWSCPRPSASATLDLLSAPFEPDCS